MIAFLRGVFAYKSPALVHLEAGGVGYELQISLNTYSRIEHLETGVLLTYYGQTVGFIVVHLRPSGLDIAFPMLLTVAELYIAYRPGIARGGGLPTDWFEGLAAWAILAALVILSIAWRLKRSNYAPALWPVIQEYKRELREDIVAASALGTLTIAFIVCRGAIGLPSAVDWAFLAVVLTVLGIGINSQWRTKMRLARQLGVEI